tara:strand:+ start:98 stop:748 length:651 start_codon:yes stop_codon:yes gene_type:complete
MDNRKSNLLLLIGCQRSGTTLLAAMLGRHSEINMLFESTTNDTMKLIGKKYCGNKLLAWRQIRIKSKSSKFGHLINRIINLDFGINRKHHKVRVFPTSCLSIQDYIHNGAKVITIFRNKEEVVNSITNRTEMSKKQAEIEYNKALEQMLYFKKETHEVQFHDLVNNPIETLTAICLFLGLEFENRMLQGSEYNFVYPHTSIIKNKSNLQPTKNKRH